MRVVVLLVVNATTKRPFAGSECRPPGIHAITVFSRNLNVALGSLSVLLAGLAVAQPASATTLYVSPTGTATSGCTTRANPCSLASAAAAAMAGDTVILMDGVYMQQPLIPQNSGTASAWITFQADDCATPILEGPGVGPDVDSTDNAVGVYSSTSEYVRFVGLVSRGWNEGFGNGWAGGTDSTAVSNGHWEIIDCAAYSNGRTGFTFFSASDFHLKNSISAHNGSSTVASWSSGVTLFEATGTLLIEGTVSFENTDQQKHTDGSGFIADEMSSNATFVNNIAFGNSGSCLRLTKSSGTKFVNNTCYRNSQFGSMATGPSNPGELYFTNAGVTIQGVTFMNNVIVGTGQAPAGSTPVQNMPTSGWSNNVVTTGTPSFFTAPTGTNPSFVPASGDTMLTGKGGTGSAVPATDIGLDPKCIVKRTPIMVGQVARVSTWQYDVDIDYIKSIGGVAKCFNAKTRSGTPDVGAYRAGTVTTVTPGSCVAPTTGTGGNGGGGSSGSGGSGGTGGRGGSGGGGAGGRGGAAGTSGGSGGATSAGAAGTGGGSAGSGQAGGGGIATGTGGTPGAGGNGGSIGGSSAAGTGGAIATAGRGGGPSTGGAGGTGVSGAGTGGSSTATGGSSGVSGSTGGSSSTPGASEPAGCGCAMSSSIAGSRFPAAVVFLAFAAIVIRRRRR
jgi:parallel beta-helix repeat protein